MLVMAMFGDRPESTARPPCRHPHALWGLSSEAGRGSGGASLADAQERHSPPAVHRPPCPRRSVPGMLAHGAGRPPGAGDLCLSAGITGARRLASPCPPSPSPFVLVSHRCRGTTESPGGLSLLPRGDAPAPGTLMAQAGPEPPVPKCWGPGSSRGRGEWARLGPLPRCPAHSLAGARQDE